MVLASTLALRTVVAAHLPLRQYTAADGLANNSVNHIASDHRGFLWFATSEGLSRFDGYSFANLTTRDGLPHRAINRILIDRKGVFWLATAKGVVRFQPERLPNESGRLLVLPYMGTSRRDFEIINYLFEDHTGRIWCATEGGVFFVDYKSAGPVLVAVDFGLRGKVSGDSNVSALAEDREGSLWAGTLDGMLHRRFPDGRLEQYSVADGLPQGEIHDLLTDRKGRVWVATRSGLLRLAPHPRPGTNIVEYHPGAADGFPNTRAYCLFESSNGDVWAGMFLYLAKFAGGEGPIQVWDKNAGLPELGVVSIGEDRDQNLWFGTPDTGVVKFSRRGFTRYFHEDGLPQGTSLPRISETVGGLLFAVGREAQGGLSINVLRGNRFEAATPYAPGIPYWGWQPVPMAVQDHFGEWWIATEGGLLRYPRLDDPAGLARVPPKAIYTVRDGLPANYVVCLHEDRNGDIWIGLDPPGMGITLWRRQDQRFQTFGQGIDRPISFAEDHDGNLWVGDWSGQIWRIHDNKIALIGGEGTDRNLINDLLIDRAGRLWAATSNKGVLRFDRPSELQPGFRSYDADDGLSSVTVRNLVEDRDGFIYLATANGIDRLDPESGHLRHFSTADGLSPGKILAAYRDKSGELWFGTAHGELSRLGPEPSKTESVPSIWITGVSVGGQPLPVSELGTSELRNLEIPAGQQQVQFTFVSLSYATGDVPRYQYRIGDQPWSEPIQSRSVHYAGLAPGVYQFAVRAINADGAVSPAPAIIDFRVLPPFWRRGWFYAVSIMTIAGAGFWGHRFRVNKLLELERIRLGIATDLHDDIGSSLSRIAILSEVAQRGHGQRDTSEVLQRIGGLAREVLDSTSDIIWAVHPQKDRLSDLQRRMRHFSADVLSAKNISMVWKAAETNSDVELGAQLRRHVYLIFKETVNNISRHSAATQVTIELALTGSELVLAIQDNGTGFDPSAESSGNGLKSIRGRAAHLKAVLDWESSPGNGTRLSLRAPLHE
jgi:ligand-binding sensor domain-containing protein